MNVKRIMKQIIKEELTAGTYDVIFGPERTQILTAELDKVAKISVEDEAIEAYLKHEAEDLARVYLTRKGL